MNHNVISFAIAVLLCLSSVRSFAQRSPGSSPISIECNATYASTLASELTDAINEALAPNSTKSINKGGSKPYWKITTPNVCDPLGMGLIGCVGGKTYEGSSTDQTTISGAYNFKVVVNLTQTSCSLSGSTGTWAATATWPKITTQSVIAINSVTGASLGLELKTQLSNMVVSLSGAFGFNYTTTQICTTELSATQSSITLDSVYVGAGATSSSGTSLTELPSIESKMSSQITTKGSTAYESANKKLSSAVGKCKVTGSSPSPRPPPSPRGRSPAGK